MARKVSKNEKIVPEAILSLNNAWMRGIAPFGANCHALSSIQFLPWMIPETPIHPDLNDYSIYGYKGDQIIYDGISIRGYCRGYG